MVILPSFSWPTMTPSHVPWRDFSSTSIGCFAAHLPLALGCSPALAMKAATRQTMVVMICRNSFINCPFIRGARMPTTARGPCSLQHIVTNLSMVETKSSDSPFGKVERRWSASGLRLACEQSEFPAVAERPDDGSRGLESTEPRGRCAPVAERRLIGWLRFTPIQASLRDASLAPLSVD